ncbi:hypothetical protein Fcan01_15981, partial [Folsomia candida]
GGNNRSTNFLFVAIVVLATSIVIQAGLIEKRRYAKVDLAKCNIFNVGKQLEPEKKGDLITYCNCTQTMILIFRKQCVEYQEISDDDNTTSTRQASSSTTVRTWRPPTTTRVSSTTTQRTTTSFPTSERSTTTFPTSTTSFPTSEKSTTSFPTTEEPTDFTTTTH